MILSSIAFAPVIVHSSPNGADFVQNHRIIYDLVVMTIDTIVRSLLTKRTWVCQQCWLIAYQFSIFRRGGWLCLSVLSVIRPPPSSSSSTTIILLLYSTQWPSKLLIVDMNYSLTPKEYDFREKCHICSHRFRNGKNASNSLKLHMDRNHGQFLEFHDSGKRSFVFHS